MPDVGLFTAGQPIGPETKVVVKYSVEVGGLPVYQESYDVENLAEELDGEPEKAAALWLRRLTGPVRCLRGPKFSANLTEWIASGTASQNSAEPGT